MPWATAVVLGYCLSCKLLRAADIASRGKKPHHDCARRKLNHITPKINHITPVRADVFSRSTCCLNASKSKKTICAPVKYNEIPNYLQQTLNESLGTCEPIAVNILPEISTNAQPNPNKIMANSLQTLGEIRQSRADPNRGGFWYDFARS